MLTHMIVWLGIGMLWLGGLIDVYRPARMSHDQVSWLGDLVIALGCTAGAVLFVHTLDPVGAGMGSVAPLYLYLAWRDRPRRKRKPSRVLAKIKDLGHRLVTVPT
jgi:hypothetical protein